MLVILPCYCDCCCTARASSVLPGTEVCTACTAAQAEGVKLGITGDVTPALVQLVFKAVSSKVMRSVVVEQVGGGWAVGWVDWLVHTLGKWLALLASARTTWQACVQASFYTTGNPTVDQTCSFMQLQVLTPVCLTYVLVCTGPAAGWAGAEGHSSHLIACGPAATHSRLGALHARGNTGGCFLSALFLSRRLMAYDILYLLTADASTDVHSCRLCCTRKTCTLAVCIVMWSVTVYAGNSKASCCSWWWPRPYVRPLVRTSSFLMAMPVSPFTTWVLRVMCGAGAVHSHLHASLRHT